jgi:hypothetical protein
MRPDGHCGAAGAGNGVLPCFRGSAFPGERLPSRQGRAARKALTVGTTSKGLRAAWHRLAARAPPLVPFPLQVFPALHRSCFRSFIGRSLIHTVSKWRRRGATARDDIRSTPPAAARRIVSRDLISTHEFSAVTRRRRWRTEGVDVDQVGGHLRQPLSLPR